MKNNKKVIISLTSWLGRIEQVDKTIISILNQTEKPDLIELNLSIDEFPNKLESLPNNLVEVIKNNTIIEINWCDGNTRAFKKLIPTLKKFYGEDYYVLTIDDDWEYSSNYVNDILEEFILNKCDKFCFSNKKCAGGFEIFNSTCFEKDMWENLTDSVIKYSLDDLYYDYYLTCKQKITKHLNDDIRDKYIKQIKHNSKNLCDEYRKTNYKENALNEMKKIKF